MSMKRKKQIEDERESNPIYCSIAPTECDKRCKATGTCTVVTSRFRGEDNTDGSTKG